MKLRIQERRREPGEFEKKKKHTEAEFEFGKSSVREKRLRASEFSSVRKRGVSSI